jgi:hypothetical protein
MRVVRVIAILGCWTSLVSASVTRLPANVRAALERPTSVQMVYSTAQVPPAVKGACASVMADHHFWLADPSKPYNETDVEWDFKIPGRRLIWAAHVPGYYVVHYEQGGRGHGYSVLVVRYQRGSLANVAWAAAGGSLKKPLRDYRAFVHAVRSGTLDDTLPYGY